MCGSSRQYQGLNSTTKRSRKRRELPVGNFPWLTSNGSKSLETRLPAQIPLPPFLVFIWKPGFGNMSFQGPPLCRHVSPLGEGLGQVSPTALPPRVCVRCWGTCLRVGVKGNHNEPPVWGYLPFRKNIQMNSTFKPDLQTKLRSCHFDGRPSPGHLDAHPGSKAMTTA